MLARSLHSTQSKLEAMRTCIAIVALLVIAGGTARAGETLPRNHPKPDKAVLEISREEFERLPILGEHSLLPVILETPGIVDQHGRGLFGGGFSSHGARMTANVLRVDGADMTDTTYGILIPNFNLDDVERIEIVTGAASVRHGRGDGAFVNVVTREGSNRHEGSFRISLRDGALDRRGSGKAWLQDESSFSREYGLALGGPVRRDRIFYFGSLSFRDLDEPQHFEETDYPIQHRTARFLSAFLKLSGALFRCCHVTATVRTDPALTHNAYTSGYRDPDQRVKQFQTARYFTLKINSALPHGIRSDTLLAATDGNELWITPDPQTGDSVCNSWDYDFCSLPPPSRYRTNRDRNELREELTRFVADFYGSHDLLFGVGYTLETSIADARQETTFEDYGRGRFQKSFSPTDSRYRPVESAHSRIYTGYLEDLWTPTPGFSMRIGLRADYQELEWNGFTGIDEVFTDPSFWSEAPVSGSAI